MISVIMTKEIIKIDIDQTVGIEQFHLVVEYNVEENYVDRPRYEQNYRKWN